MNAIDLPSGWCTYFDFKRGVILMFDPEKIDLTAGLPDDFFYPPQQSELFADRPNDPALPCSRK